MTGLMQPAIRCVAASLRALCLLALLVAMPFEASAQGCSMCRETAAFQKDRAIGALQRGIAALAIPPLGIAIGLAWFTWKRSNRFASN